VAAVFSEVQACNVDEHIHAVGFPARNCFPTVFWAAAEVEKRCTLEKNKLSIHIHTYTHMRARARAHTHTILVIIIKYT
jgi:hypothetical protein